MKKLWQEGVLVAMIGGAVAFAANWLSPHGLKLTRDYFPGNSVVPPTALVKTNPAGAPITNSSSPVELLSARLKANGLQLAASNQVIQFFADPRRELDGVIFIDARYEQEYRAGHIPGAYYFDRFRPENYLSNVVQVCITAQAIVFYCDGGECDASEHSAIMLRDSLNIPKEKVFVYGGGFTEWTNNELPYEVGGRNSGQLTNVVKAPGSAKAEAPKS